MAGRGAGRGAGRLHLRLDHETTGRARILAERRSIPVGRPVADVIEALVEADDQYERARVVAARHLVRGFDMGSGGRLPARECSPERPDDIGTPDPKSSR